jgi:alkylation response protein AidB-like acyl-CoA dehydrogenase
VDVEFGWSPAQVAYRRRLQAFLEREMPKDWFDQYAHGIGSPQQINFSRTFCPKLAEADLLLPQWPKEYGGQDGQPWEQFILSEEMWTWAEPRGPQYMNVNWIGYALMKYGTPEQKAEHLGRIASGNVIWCQGFSEPQAGTDLAALQTSATRTENGYRISGQKVWTGYAHMADWCFVLARMGPERKNISTFLVPMDVPGVTVTPIPGLCEDGHMNEVFFDNVEVPRSALLGQEGKGWEIITFALGYERVGAPRYHFGRIALDRAVAQLKQEGRFSDPLVRAAAGRIVAKLEAGRLLNYAVVDLRVKDRPAGVVGNIQRVTTAEAILDLMDFLVEYLPDALVGGDRYLTFSYRSQVSGTIAAGTYELQLDIIAQRGLGLPRER